MIKLMEKPKDSEFPFFHLDECECKVFSGKEVKFDFCDVGKLHECHIPNCLQQQNWQPINDKNYLVWFHYVSLNDPRIYDYVTMDYIEMYEDKEIDSTVSFNEIGNIDHSIDVLKAFKNKHVIEYSEIGKDDWKIADYHTIFQCIDYKKYKTRIK